MHMPLRQAKTLAELCATFACTILPQLVTSRDVENEVSFIVPFGKRTVPIFSRIFRSTLNIMVCAVPIT